MISKDVGLGFVSVTVVTVTIWFCFCDSGDGDYNVTALTHATLNYTGMVSWEPPVITKSYCDINVKYFPFDEQTCYLKFGTWSYNYDMVC